MVYLYSSFIMYMIFFVGSNKRREISEGVKSVVAAAAEKMFILLTTLFKVLFDLCELTSQFANSMQ